MPSLDAHSQLSADIAPLESPADLAAGYALMRARQPQLSEARYVEAAARLRKEQGLELAGLAGPGGLDAVAAFRRGESLAWGRFLGVDELVAGEAGKDRGAGARLLAWLKEKALEEGRPQLHLDVGTQRHPAHRFYLEQGLDLVFYHFSRVLEPGQAPGAPHPEVRVAETDDQIAQCAPVMLQLRPQVPAQDFVATVRRMERSDGFKLAGLWEGGRVSCVAGYRFGESLAWGRYLYLDDLSTDAALRSRGGGKKVLDWLLALAQRRRCDQFHLDSGTQRHAAHRFYLRERFDITAFHFKAELGRDAAA